ncbi:hypothetical protein R3P38DRAFT_3174101 [Favolaschia claudopus]|uniref:Uncharacterized protein n=1 Tax=Favolaschia claudopus TaxID=2862362 RepID=A0AAW0DGQ3_9AGAR
MSAVLAEAVFRALVRRTANNHVLKTHRPLNFKYLPIFSCFTLPAFAMPADRASKSTRTTATPADRIKKSGTRKPRVSSPKMPPAPLIEPRTATQLQKAETRLANDEPARVVANREVCEAGEAAAADPTNPIKALKEKWAVEDYEELYGDFVVEPEIEVFVDRRDRDRAAIDSLRLLIKRYPAIDVLPEVQRLITMIASNKAKATIATADYRNTRHYI